MLKHRDFFTFTASSVVSSNDVRCAAAVMQRTCRSMNLVQYLGVV